MKVSPFPSLFNFADLKRRKIERSINNFNNWCRKNPQAAGKDKIEIEEKTEFEKFYRYKRPRNLFKDRSFDLFYLNSDNQKIKQFNNNKILHQLLQLQITHIRRKSC